MVELEGEWRLRGHVGDGDKEMGHMNILTVSKVLRLRKGEGLWTWILFD